MPELAAALSKRLIVAAPLSAPTHIRARAAGAQPLLDMAKAGVYFPHTAVITRRAYLKTNRETALNFSGAILKACSDSFKTRLRQRRSSRSTPAILPRISSKLPINTPSITWSARRIPIVKVSLKRSTQPKPGGEKATDQFIDLELVKNIRRTGFFRQIGMQK
jgi:hypothetical protein